MQTCRAYGTRIFKGGFDAGLKARFTRPFLKQQQHLRMARRALRKRVDRATGDADGRCSCRRPSRREPFFERADGHERAGALAAEAPGDILGAGVRNGLCIHDAL